MRVDVLYVSGRDAELVKNIPVLSKDKDNYYIVKIHREIHRFKDDNILYYSPLRVFPSLRRKMIIIDASKINAVNLKNDENDTLSSAEISKLIDYIVMNIKLLMQDAKEIMIIILLLISIIVSLAGVIV